MDEKAEFILKYFSVQPGLDAPFHMVSPQFKQTDVEQLIGHLVEQGYLVIYDNSPVLTEKGQQYVDDNRDLRPLNNISG